MAIRSIAFRSRRYAAESNLVQLVPLAIGLESRVEEVRTVGESRTRHVSWVTLAEQGLHDVHHPA